MKSNSLASILHVPGALCKGVKIVVPFYPLLIDILQCLLFFRMLVSMVVLNVTTSLCPQAFEELVAKILEMPGMDSQQTPNENAGVKIKGGKAPAAGACGC